MLPVSVKYNFENAINAVNATKPREIRHKVGFSVLAAFALLGGAAFLVSSYFLARALVQAIPTGGTNHPLTIFLKMVPPAAAIATTGALVTGGLVSMTLGTGLAVTRARFLNFKRDKALELLKGDQFASELDKAKFIHRYYEYLKPYYPSKLGKMARVNREGDVNAYVRNFLIPMFNHVNPADIDERVDLKVLIPAIISTHPEFKFEFLNAFLNSESKDNDDLRKVVLKSCGDVISQLDVTKANLYQVEDFSRLRRLRELKVDQTRIPSSFSSGYLNFLEITNFSNLDPNELFKNFPNLLRLTVHISDEVSLEQVDEFIQKTLTLIPSNRNRCFSLNIQLQTDKITSKMIADRIPNDFLRRFILHPNEQAKTISLIYRF